MTMSKDSDRPEVDHPKTWVLPMTPNMIVEQEWRERVMTPTAAEVDALIAAFDAAILPEDDDS